MIAERLFCAIARPRLAARLEAAARRPITVLAAPAGFGKSVALGQFLDRRHIECARFDVRREHCTLAAFVSGLTAAIAAVATNANAERAAAQLETFAGIVAIDDLHVALGDPEIVRFLTASIERTKARITWVLATRVVADLPVGTWLAYEDCELIVDERDLRFTFDETTDAAQSYGLSIAPEELRELQDVTDGWPVGIGFGLRAFAQSGDISVARAAAREMMYRFISEQIYERLEDDERDLL